MSNQPPEERPAPGFGELLRGNLRVLAWVVLVVLVAFLAWRGLRWLFPDVGWLRIPAR